MYNKVILIGNVVKDCETKTVKASKVTKFRLAVDDPYKKDSVLYIDVEAWDKQAEFATKWLKKGKGVIVDGRLCMDSWEKDGKKESKIFVKAADIRFSNVGMGKSEGAESKPQQEKSVKKTQQVVQNDDEFSDVPF
jgi:single-strand DNA-binding protein